MENVTMESDMHNQQKGIDNVRYKVLGMHINITFPIHVDNKPVKSKYLAIQLKGYCRHLCMSSIRPYLRVF